MNQAEELQQEDATRDEVQGQDPQEPAQDDEHTKSRIQRMRELEPVRLVEAALFTAGRPVGVDELAQATGLSPDVVKKAARSLANEYEEREDATALEVSMAGAKWAMQLKTIYVEHAQTLARMEIPKKTLKTLALIAFHQPLLQSELVDMIGSKTYEHVRELSELGLVKSRPEGLSKRLTTADEFPEYFGIPATDNHQIRAYLAKKVGLSLSELKGKADLDDFTQEPPASPAEVEAAAREKAETDAAAGDDSSEQGEKGDEDVGEEHQGQGDEEGSVDEEPVRDEGPHVVPESHETQSPAGS